LSRYICSQRCARCPPTSSCAPQSRLLEVHFDDGSHFELPFEYLRVFSPSAEVKGHGGGEGMLQTGKAECRYHRVEPVGNYALRCCSTTATTPGSIPGACCTSWAAIAEELGALSRALRRGRGAAPAERCAKRSGCRLQCATTQLEEHRDATPTARSISVSRKVAWAEKAERVRACSPRSPASTTS
jgi:hypothetical protein